MYQNTANEKFFYSKLALGEESPPLTFFGSDTVTIDSTTSFGNNSTMHPITSNHEEEPSSLIPNETSCRETRVILPQRKEHKPLNKRVELTYRLLQESVGIFTTKINAIARNITAVTALQCFKSRLILCKSEEQLLSALNNFGSHSWRKNAGRKIQCQPSTVSQQRIGVPRCAAPLSRGRPSKQLGATIRTKRRRKLAENIKYNKSNAKSH